MRFGQGKMALEMTMLKCGRWKMVDALPDLKIQFVTAFPDLKIKYVNAFPGLP
jgi:hypothetical protein